MKHKPYEARGCVIFATPSPFRYFPSPGCEYFSQYSVLNQKIKIRIHTDCLEIWEPQPPATFGNCTHLYRGCFCMSSLAGASLYSWCNCRFFPFLKTVHIRHYVHQAGILSCFHVTLVNTLHPLNPHDRLTFRSIVSSCM